jgi:hypothetical protein
MLTGQRQQAVIPLVGHRAVSVSAPLRYEESVWPIEGPSMGLLRRPTPGEIVEGERFSRPYGPGALCAHQRKPTCRFTPAALLPPVTPDMVEAVALHHGVCIRPVPGSLDPDADLPCQQGREEAQP